MENKTIDLNILQIFINQNETKEFKKKFEKYKETIERLQYENLGSDEFESYQRVKEEIESLFYTNGLQNTIDEVNKSNIKILNEKILNKIEFFEEETEGLLLKKVEDFFHKVIEKTNKKIDPNYGSIRTTVDGFKIQISYRLVD